MNVKNNNIPDWKLIYLSSLIGMSIVLNYFLWSINSYGILKYLNFFILIFLTIYFLIGKDFQKYNFVRLFFISLLVLCLGSVTIDWDARSVWSFHAKRIFFDNNLYSGFDNYMPELMNAYPLLPASLSATLTKIIGHWNEIYPKSTNLLVLLPALLIQCSFLKNYKLTLIWTTFILLFSGRILINGLMDGLVAMYFVSSCLLIFYLFFEESQNIASLKNIKKKNRLLLLISGISSGIILTLLKNEGFVLVSLIFLITILFKLLYKKKFFVEDIVFWAIIFTPVIIWKIMTVQNGIYPRIMGFGLGETLYSQNILERFFLRALEIRNYKIIFSSLVLNEKFLLSVLIFIFCFFKMFKKNKLIFNFILLNSLSYYFLLYFVYFSTPHNLEWHLNSSHRVIISIVLMLTFFSIYIFQRKKKFNL
tara:strand:- start:319 stop:1581 length:1263 start_codon:yes stop_codon:yes gene_type:complete